MKIKMQKQTSISECGLCVISMFLQFYGFIENISYYRSLYNVGRNGLSIKDIFDILSDNNINVEVKKVINISKFQFVINKPYIVFVRGSHYILLIKKGNDIFEIYDPSKRKERVSLSKIEKIFGGYILYGIPNDSFKQKKTNIGEFRNLKVILKGIKKYIFFSIISTLFFELISLTYSIFFKNVIDNISNGNSSIIEKITAPFIAIVVFLFISSIIRNNIFLMFQKKLLEKTNLEFYNRMLKYHYSFFDNRNSGELIYRIGLVNTVSDFVSTTIPQIIIKICTIFIVSIFLLYKYNMIAVFTIFIILIYAIILYFAGTIIYNIQSKEIKASEKINQIQVDTITTIFQIKSMKIEDVFEKRYLDSYDEFIETYTKSKKINYNVSLIISLISLISPFFLIIYIYYIGVEKSIGGIVLIYTLFQNLISSISNLVNELIKAKAMQSNMSYVNDLYDVQIDNTEGTLEINNFNRLEIKSGEFCYGLGKSFSLDDINFHINSGEKIALVGISGSGKTTLVKILSGLYRLDAGKLLINNMNYSELKKKSIAKMISILPQQPILFTGTLRDNITLGEDKYSENQIYEVLKIACMLDEVMQMPLKLDTPINLQGGILSGGQIQRISIARALLKKPKILIMDEATSSLDVINELKIYENLSKEKISLIVITHRLTTITDADRIYLLEKGKIIDNGTHEYMYLNNEIYYSLFNSIDKEIK